MYSLAFRMNRTGHLRSIIAWHTPIARSHSKKGPVPFHPASAAVTAITMVHLAAWVSDSCIALVFINPFDALSTEIPHVATSGAEGKACRNKPTRRLGLIDLRVLTDDSQGSGAVRAIKLRYSPCSSFPLSSSSV